MTGLTEDCLALLRERAGEPVTAAGAAHVLFADYVYAAPTSSECERSLEWLVRRGLATVQHGGQFGPEYRLKTPIPPKE